MKNIKIYFLSLLLGLAPLIFSCSDDDPVVPEQPSTPSTPSEPETPDDPSDEEDVVPEFASIVGSVPEVLQQSSDDVVLYYRADRGSKGLNGQPSTSPVYAHIGVITNKSTSSVDWKYAPTWGNNADKYKLEFVDSNLWKLKIGNLRSYFGITDPSEKIEKIALVFRNADGTKEGKTEEGSDIFVDVFEDGFQVMLSGSSTSNIFFQSTEVVFNASTTEKADIVIYVNDNAIAQAENATSLSAKYTFSTGGEYSVTASATSVANGETAIVATEYLFVESSQEEPYPGGEPKMGATVNPDGSVTFCIAAPQKKNVMLFGAWNNYEAEASQVMKYQDYNGQRYFWTTVAGIDPETEYPYYYLVDGKNAVADPYARLVLDPWNDQYISASVYPSMPAYPAGQVPTNTMLSVHKSNGYPYNWTVTDFRIPSHDNLVIYEMLFRDFTGTEGAANANGTVRQAIDKIPYLVDLGVNAVELMPIMEFSGNNSWGYNTNFYFAPDKAYGTPTDYKEFIDKCHQNGMAVILDIVFNQSDGLHPWYVMYDGVASNPFYNSRAPHDYSVLNDWNQDNALVQQQWHDALRYWMEEYNVDGFRFDLVKGLGDNNSYGAGTDSYNASRVARMKELHDVLKSVNPDAIHINENLAQAKEENEMGAYGQLNWANVSEPSMQFAMGWENANLNRFYAKLDGGRTVGTTVSYAESHDEQRMAYKQQQWAVDAVKKSRELQMRRLGSVAAQMLMAPGAHMIWQFGEFGADENTKTDIGNDVNPKKVVWNYLNDEHRASLHNSYKELIAIRKAHPDLFNGSTEYNATGFTNGTTDKRVQQNISGTKEIITLVNQNPEATMTVSADSKNIGESNYHILSSSPGVDTSKLSVSGNKVTCDLPGGAYIVIGNFSK